MPLLPSLRVCIYLGLLAVTAWPLAAQTATGTLTGSVRDESNTVIAGAKLELVSESRGTVRQATSNPSGFAMSLLSPDTYRLVVKKDGFAPTEVFPVVVGVGDQIAIDVQLKVATVATSVTVIDAPARMQESPTLGASIDRQFLENLPLNGRTFQSLILLTPGVVTSTVALFSFRPGQFSVNGQRESANYFTVDGVSANVGILAGTSPIGMEGQYAAFNALGGTNGLASVDALQEFKIQTSNFAPEYGRTPGAQVSLVTRSGTNDFHGTAFTYYRDDAFDANDWFANSRGLPRAAFRNFQYGGVLGGPIVKDRTFFFGSYEGMRLRIPQVGIRDVPSLALRQAVSSPMKNILNSFPVPNGRDYGNGFAEYSASWSNPAGSDATAIRIDHHINSRISVFGRYNYAPSDSASRGPSLTGNANLAALTTNFAKLHTATAGSTFLVSPTLVNEIRFNYSHSRYGNQTVMDDFGGAVPVDYAAVAPPYLKPGVHGFGVLITGTTANYSLVPQVANSMQQVQVVDTVSHVRGPHEIKFGIDYRPLFPQHASIPYSLSLRFANQADLSGGIVDIATSSARTGSRSPRYLNLSLFAQDTWKATHRLTLSYGLRWEFNPPPKENTGHEMPAVINVYDPPNTDIDPTRTFAWDTRYNNFAPRVGAAYHANTSPRFGTIVRGGFGIFYDLVTANAGYGYSTVMWPNSSVRRDLRTPFPLQGNVATAPVVARVPPYYLHAFSPDLKLPFTKQWNFTIEQSLGTEQVLSLSYVGNAGRRLYRGYSFTPNPRFTALFLTTNEDYSDYHALQAQFQRRLSGGFQLNASYTLSKALDTNSGEQDLYANSDFYLAPAALDRGPADFDVRHSGSFALTYYLPGRPSSAIARALYSGWALDSIFRARSSNPIDIFSSAVNFAKTWRPNRILGVPLYVDDPHAPGGQRVNRAAFSTPVNGVHGTLGRNVVRGLGASQLDVAVRRTITITERVGAEVRLEAFNILNHPNFGNPIHDLANAQFGLPTQMLNRSLGNLNSLYQIGGPRSMQVGLKLRF